MKGDWLVRVPATMTTRDAMAIGTAGYTAMLAVMALEKHGITPDRGPQVVTGAAGGVGSVAVALLAKLGYEVTASTGRPEEADYLKGLGAKEMIERKELPGTPRAAREGALGRRRRFGRLDHARQCAVDDALPRRGCGLRARRRYGFADVGRAFHFARGVAFGHQLRLSPAPRPGSRLETPRNRSRSCEIGGNDRRNRPVRRHGGGPADRRGSGPRSKSWSRLGKDVHDLATIIRQDRHNRMVTRG